MRLILLTDCVESWSFSQGLKSLNFHTNPRILSVRVVTAPLKEQIFTTTFGPRSKNIYPDTLRKSYLFQWRNLQN